MRVVLTIMVTLLLLAGCGKKWEDTASTTFDVELLSQAGQSHFNLTGGAVYLNHFTLSGMRVQSDDVTLTKNFKNPLVIEVDNGTLSVRLRMDVPQGSYTELQFDVHFVGGSKELAVEGAYTNESGQDYDVSFELGKEVKAVTQVSKPGGSEIDLVAGRNHQATVSVNLLSWFTSVTDAMWNDADVQTGSGNPLIVISKQKNKDLYKVIEEEISNSVEVDFE